MNDHLTISQAANELNIHVETLRRWDRSGKLKAVRVGSKGYRRYPVKLIQQIKKEGLVTIDRDVDDFPSTSFADNTINFHAPPFSTPQYFTKTVFAVATQVEGFVDCELVDAPGDKKRDIIGYELKKYNKKDLIYIQCKRVRNLTKKELEEEVDGLFKHINEGKIGHPKKIIFATSTNTHVSIRDSIRAYVKQLLPKIEAVVFWCQDELNQKIKSSDQVMKTYIFVSPGLLQASNYKSLAEPPETNIHEQFVRGKASDETEISKSYSEKIKWSSQLINQGKFEEAKEVLIRLVGEIPSNGFNEELSRVYNNLGLTYKNEYPPNFTKSIDAFEKSIELDSKTWKPKCNLSHLLLLRNEEGDVERSWTLIDSVWREEKASDPFILITYLQAYELKTNEDQVINKIKELQTELKSDEGKLSEVFSNPGFRFYLASKHLNKNELDEAEVLVNINLAENEFDVDALYLKAIINFRQAKQHFPETSDDFLPAFEYPDKVIASEKLLRKSFKLASEQGRKDLLPEIFHNWNLTRLWIWKNKGEKLEKIEYTPEENFAERTTVIKMQELIMENRQQQAYEELKPHIESLTLREIIEISDRFFWHGAAEISLQLLEKAEEKFSSKLPSDYWLIKSLRQVLLADQFGGIQSCNLAKEVAKTETKEKRQQALSHYGALASRYKKEGDRLLDNMLEFDQEFPELKAVTKFNFNDSKDKEILVESFKKQRVWFEGIVDTYKNNPLPVYSLEKPFKAPFIELWQGRGVNFPWEYINPSPLFEEEVLEVLSQADGVIFDYMSLLTLTQANLLGYLNKLNKKFCIHYLTFRKIQQELIEFESEHLRKLWNFLRNSRQIEFIYDEKQVDPKLQKLNSILDDWLIQTIQHAKNNKMSLVTDDLRLLMVLRNEGLNVTNSYAFLKLYLKNKWIDNKSYSQALGLIADCVYSFIPFNAQDLHEIIWLDDYKLSRRSYHLIHQVFLPNSDVSSFMELFISFTALLWRSGALAEDKVYWLCLITEELSNLFSTWVTGANQSIDDNKLKFGDQFAKLWGVAISLGGDEELEVLETKINDIMNEEFFEIVKPTLIKHVQMRLGILRSAKPLGST